MNKDLPVGEYVTVVTGTRVKKYMYMQDVLQIDMEVKSPGKYAKRKLRFEVRGIVSSPTREKEVR